MVEKRCNRNFLSCPATVSMLFKKDGSNLSPECNETVSTQRTRTRVSLYSLKSVTSRQMSFNANADGEKKQFYVIEEVGCCAR